MFGELVGTLVGALDGFGDGLGSLLVCHGLRREREERLHVEGNAHDGDHAHEREHQRTPADGAVVAQGAELDEVALDISRALLVAHDEDAVERHRRHYDEEDEQDHRDGDVAGCSHIGSGNRAYIVRVADERNAAVEALAIEGHPAGVAVFKVFNGDAGVERVGTHEIRIGMILDDIGLRGEREDVPTLAEGDVAEHAFGRAGRLDEVAELGGALLDDDHRLVIDLSGIVAHEPVLVGQLDLDGARGLTGREALAEVVEARVAEVGSRVGGTGYDRAVRLDDHDVVDFQQLLVFGHLGIGRLEAHVV